MNVKDTFLRLTNMTYPYGCEDQLASLLPKGYQVDEDGNYFYEIIDSIESKIIFTCHLDTACKKQEIVNHVFDGNFVRTDGKTILRADDKAGMTILLFMIYHNVPGLYYFFIGEEVGCIGSKAASFRKDFFSKYEKIVSFDRRDTCSIITYQSSRRCCSDEFADSLSKEYSKYGLTLEKDDGGVYTDSAEFTDIIPECTNISVGYYKEHTHQEYQDIRFLERLANASVLINWSRLVIKRDPSKNEWLHSARFHRSGRHYDFSDFDYGYTSSGSRKSARWSNSSKNNTSKKNGKVYMNDIDDEIEKIETSFRSKKNGKIYIPHGEDFIVNDSHKTNYYEGIKRMLLDDTLSLKELRIIEDQCLDLDDTNDKNFLSYLKNATLIGPF
jgi:hypothetical protein